MAKMYGDWNGLMVRGINLEISHAYFRHEEDRLVAIPASEVPEETNLLEKEFKLAEPGEPFTSPAKGAWTNPGAAAGPFKVILADGSLVTYSLVSFC